MEATLAAISDKLFIIPTVFAWTDSQVTVAWLRELPRKWKTFVANRVAKFQEIPPAEKWKFVPTKDNPAGCASRGIPSSALAYHELWWNGPTWLSQLELHNSSQAGFASGSSKRSIWNNCYMRYPDSGWY